MPTVPLFRRKDRAQPDPRPAIAGFWAWWAQADGGIDAALSAGDAEAVAAQLAPRVRAVHHDLGWHIDPGVTSRHRLVLSSDGRPDLRGIAERWALAAPPADDAFAYAAARPRSPQAFGGSVQVEDYDIPLDEVVVGTRLDAQRQRIDIVVHHPLFPLLGDDGRRHVAFLALVAAIGEDDVERWLGTLGVSADAPVDAFPATVLDSVVDQLRPTGHGGWIVLQGRTPRGQLVARVRRPFCRVDRPLCDTHVALTLTLPASTADPDTVVAEVDALEEAALAALGGDGPHAVAVARETLGRRAVLHLYVDGLEADPFAVRPLVQAWPHGRAALHVALDPAWREIGHLLA